MPDVLKQACHFVPYPALSKVKNEKKIFPISGILSQAKEQITFMGVFVVFLSLSPVGLFCECCRISLLQFGQKGPVSWFINDNAKNLMSKFPCYTTELKF